LKNRRQVGDKAFKMISHLLFETASGYGIFEAKLHEDIGSRSQAVQDSIKDLAKFGKMVSLISFSPFKNAAEALQNANDISEGQQRLSLVGYLTE
jgi:nucleolar protein 56